VTSTDDQGPLSALRDHSQQLLDLTEAYARTRHELLLPYIGLKIADLMELALALRRPRRERPPLRQPVLRLVRDNDRPTK
jgi:hypothetical protein